MTFLYVLLWARTQTHNCIPPLNFYQAVSLLQSTNHIPIGYLFCVYSIHSEEARSFLKTSSMPYSEGEVIVEDTLEQKSEDLRLKLMCQQHNPLSLNFPLSVKWMYHKLQCSMIMRFKLVIMRNLLQHKSDINIIIFLII